MLGKILIYVGILLVILGLIVLNINKMSFLGKLPGDIRIERENFSFYFPFTTGLLLSAIISLAVFIIQRLR